MGSLAPIIVQIHSTGYQRQQILVPYGAGNSETKCFKSFWIEFSIWMPYYPMHFCKTHSYNCLFETISGDVLLFGSWSRRSIDSLTTKHGLLSFSFWNGWWWIPKDFISCLWNLDPLHCIFKYTNSFRFVPNLNRTLSRHFIVMLRFRSLNALPLEWYCTMNPLIRILLLSYFLNNPFESEIILNQHPLEI